MAESYNRRINLYINVDGKEVKNNVKSIRGELAHLVNAQNQMTIGSEEYRKQTMKIQQLKSVLKGHAENIGQIQTPMQKAISTAKGLLPAFGFTAIAAGAKMAFDKVVNSTDVLSTKWAVFTGGLQSGMNEFWRTIAVGDWSNFTENMRAAIKVGREYETMLDDIEEKGRALRIKEAQSRGEELRLEEALKNTGLSKSERLAAGQARIKLEDDLAKERVKIAQDTFDAELKVTIQQTRLSKDRLMEVVSDMDSETKIKAKAYLEQQNLYESTLKKNDQFKVAASRSGITENPFAKEIAESKAVLDSYPESVKIYAEAIKGVGSTTDEQLNKMVAGYEGLVQAQNSSAENTKKVRTMVNGLFAEEDSEAAKIAAKKIDAAKKLSDELSAFFEKDGEAQKAAINRYFKEAGEGAFDAFIKAIEEKQKSKTIDFSISPENPGETEKQDPTLDYASQKYKESIEYQLLLNETLHENGLRGEQEYQDELTRLNQEAEDKRNATRAESIEKAQQLAQLGANFVSALMDMELAAAGDNEEKKAAIRKKYARVQFLVSASQIIVDTASAIMKALAQLGPIGGPIAAGIIGATGAVQLATAYQQANAVEGYADGGYTNGDHLYRAGEAGKEWIAPNSLLRNPFTSSIIAGLEDLRRSKVSVTSGAFAVSKQFSGSMFQNTTGSQTAGTKETVIQTASDPELKTIMAENTKAIRELMRWKPKVTSELIKKDIDTLNHIEQNRGL